MGERESLLCLSVSLNLARISGLVYAAKTSSRVPNFLAKLKGAKARLLRAINTDFAENVPVAVLQSVIMLPTLSVRICRISRPNTG